MRAFALLLFLYLVAIGQPMLPTNALPNRTFHINTNTPVPPPTNMIARWDNACPWVKGVRWRVFWTSGFGGTNKWIEMTNTINTNILFAPGYVMVATTTNTN
jgi:hypothetical protein